MPTPSFKPIASLNRTQQQTTVTVRNSSLGDLNLGLAQAYPTITIDPSASPPIQEAQVKAIQATNRLVQNQTNAISVYVQAEVEPIRGDIQNIQTQIDSINSQIATGIGTSTITYTNGGGGGIDGVLAGGDLIGTYPNPTIKSITLGSDAIGDIYYRNASGLLSRLGPGTSGYVLRTNGAGAAPSWAAGGGSYINGTGLNLVSTTFSVIYGTTAGTAAQGNDSRLSDARTPTGTAGGDLAGTYPNPTVSKVTVATATNIPFDINGGTVAKIYPSGMLAIGTATSQLDLGIAAFITPNGSGYATLDNVGGPVLLASLNNANIASYGDTGYAMKLKFSSLQMDIGSDAQGDILYRGADSKIKRLGAGTSGQVLKTGGPAANPSWTTVAAGPGIVIANSATQIEVSSSLIAGPNITITTQSNGTIAISASITAPVSFAEFAVAEGLRRKGPVVMSDWSDSVYVGALTAPAGAAQPSIVRGSSGCLTVYSDRAGTYGNTHIAASHDLGSSRGWVLAVNGSNLYLYSMSGATQVNFTSAVSTIGWHTIAWSIDASGVIHWTLDGGAITTPVETPTLTARNGDDVKIGRGVFNGVPSSIPIAYIAIWDSVLSDATLQRIATSASHGAPNLPSLPTWEWAAAAHVGVQLITINSIKYQSIGPVLIWMP